VPNIPGLEAAFFQGLKETGFIEGRNVNIEYRSAEGQYHRLPSLAAELVSRDVAVIFSADAPSAFAAKAATRTIPIVFVTGADPVKSGLVDSFSRPGGNITGVSVLISVLGPKRLELLGELLPDVSTIVLLVNPSNPNARLDAPATQSAAETLGLHLKTLNAGTEADLESAFATMTQQKVRALIVVPDPFFIVWRSKLVTLATHHAISAIYPIREFVEIGGLMSYGSRLAHLNQLAGALTGKILRGANPADTPVQQSANFELLINLKTAKSLGLTVPPSLLARADEVIE
jgi:putative ABC transport system substrate-binding protein